MKQAPAFEIPVGYPDMREHPPLGRRNLVNLALTLWVPLPAAACAIGLFRWFPAFLVLALMACAAAPAADQVDEAPIIDPMDIHHPVAVRSGMVVSSAAPVS